MKKMVLPATIVGIIGNIISTGLFLSPIPTFARICKERSTKDFKGLPYVVTLTNCLLWVWYGLPWVKTNIPVITINALGSALQLTYVSIYLIFAPWNKRARTVPFLVAILAMVGTVVAITLCAFHTAESRKIFVGVLCVVFTTGMNVAPLSIMRLVIATGSVEFMPFYLSLFVFANGAAWFIYGLLTSDIFIIIPNGLGTLLGATQLILYAIYRRVKPRRVEDDKGQVAKTDEMGRQLPKTDDVEMGRQQQQQQQTV